ncbi:hypothetical protein HELRODRAFT_111970 [Helobdella robusta]|uniref:RRM domain-containing protein n=1 Tax=Helobdella robusta TaxID=6412 RepID=T1EFG1_HELRO|nr:hypothetical protein HELRODRAFT_111970 [Helobdella robusta]ESO03534.1 hypothetical protein HELRODRAFT_111970 [Helobdella robusta]
MTSSSSTNPSFETTSAPKKNWSLQTNAIQSNPTTVAINNPARIPYPLIRVATPMNILAFGSFPPTPIAMNATSTKVHKSTIQRSSSVSFDQTTTTGQQSSSNNNKSSSSSSGQHHHHHHHHHHNQHPPPASSSSSSAGLFSDQLSKTNLYIRGLKPETSDKDLLNMCSQYGSISSTKAIIDQATGKCKGYGFVDFSNEKGAELAVKTLQSNGIQAQMAKQQEQDSTNLYIANLPDYFNESDLEQLISSVGNIVSTRILREVSGKSRGVGFARLESRECCEKVIQAFNRSSLPS